MVITISVNSRLINTSITYLIFSEYWVDTPRPELGEYINALPFERHII